MGKPLMEAIKEWCDDNPYRDWKKGLPSLSERMAQRIEKMNMDIREAFSKTDGEKDE